MKQELEKQDIQMQQDNSSLVAIIDKAAMNPDVDVEKMERLLEIQMRVMDKQAEMQFNHDFSKMQNELPEITEGGCIKHNQTVISRYARWDEDINPIIKPILSSHGFSLSFRVNTKERIDVTAVLSHIGGHSIQTEISLPHDSSGAKNAVQAVGSSVSYGKRYTAGSLLNLTTGGMDDDGRGPELPKISASEVKQVEGKIKSVLGENTKPFYGWMSKTLKCNDIKDLNQNGYNEVMGMLERKEKEKK